MAFALVRHGMLETDDEGTKVVLGISEEDIALVIMIVLHSSKMDHVKCLPDVGVGWMIVACGVQEQAMELTDPTRPMTQNPLVRLWAYRHVPKQDIAKAPD